MGGIYYPQASLILNIRWEDFGDGTNARLKDVPSLPILARRVRVSINDYTQADTFEAEIDYKNFPFDPRCIRSCGVSIFMENTKTLYQANNSPNRIQPRSEAKVINGVELPSNAVFVGFADEESIKFDDSTRTVTLEGRDFTSLLIDTKYLKGTVNLEQPVDVVLKSLLSELKTTENLKLDDRVGTALPVLASFWGEKDALSGKKNVKREETYWDVIQDIVGRAGLIAYIELDKLVLSKPRVLYDRAKVTRFVYGRNLASLEFKRKLGRRKNFNIVVRSLNLNTKEVLEAKIPADATEEWSKATGISNTEVKLPEMKPDGTPVPEAEAKPAQYISFRIPNVANQDQLVAIGQEIYEEIGRQQIEGSCETFDMETVESKQNGADPACFDILKLRNGTPLSIEIDQGDLAGLSRLTDVQSREKFLLERCYHPKVARALAETLGKFSTPLYTKAVEFTLDADRGFKAKIDFVNFIETSNRSMTGRT